MKRALVMMVLWMGAVHLMGCTQDADDERAAIQPDTDANNDTSPGAQEPLPIDGPGAFNVGFQRHEFQYTPAGQEALRTIRVVIWYPTEDTEGEDAYYGDLLPREGIFDGASVALNAPAPVLIFSHGSQAVAEQSWTTMEFYASHGWIVVAMDHPDNTLFDNTGDMASQIDWRPQDVSHTLDYIEALQGPETLANLFSDQIMMGGHSFGGTTTLIVSGAGFDVDNLDEVCEFFNENCQVLEEARGRLAQGYHDPRIKVAFSMTPGGYVLFSDEGLAKIQIPMMIITGGRDSRLPNEEEGDPIWAAMERDDNLRLDFPQAGHLTFSNLCELISGFGEDDGCGDDFMDPAEAHRVVNAYTMAFARHHLQANDTDTDLITGQRTFSNEVVISVAP